MRTRMSRLAAWSLLAAVLMCPALLTTSAHFRIAAGGGGDAAVSASDVSWSVDRIGAPVAWQRTKGSTEIVVAVIDSGISRNASQLAGKLWVNRDEIPDNGIDDDDNGYVDDIHGWDFRDGDPGSDVGSPIHWHGTFVAGIVAAAPDAEAVGGVAPGVRIMDVRFLDSRNLFYGRDWNRFAQAVDYAVDNGARIINLSIYANGRPPASVEAALVRAQRSGVIVVGIAGNNSKAEVSYPGKLTSVLAVTATSQCDELALFSNYGPEVAAAAPGVSIVSIDPAGQRKEASGTSFAAPHVAATLALILSADPSLGAEEAIAQLVDACSDLGECGCDPRYGAGLIQAGEAVTGL